MKLEFEDKLDFELEAIKSITDIFIEQSLKDNRSLFNFTDSGSIAMMGNELVLSDERLEYIKYKVVRTVGRIVGQLQE